MAHKNVLVRSNRSKSVISTCNNIKAHSLDHRTAVPLAFMGPMDALCFAVSVSLLLRCASDGNDCRIHQMGGVIWRCSISRRAKEHRSFTKMCDIIMVSACMRYPSSSLPNKSVLHLWVANTILPFVDLLLASCRFIPPPHPRV